MNQPSTQPSRGRIVVCERVGDYVLTAFERPELASPTDRTSPTRTNERPTPAESQTEEG